MLKLSLVATAVHALKIRTMFADGIALQLRGAEDELGGINLGGDAGDSAAGGDSGAGDSGAGGDSGAAASGDSGAAAAAAPKAAAEPKKEETTEEKVQAVE